jgi:predicted RNase H-like HicB family nuclease
VKTYDLYLDSGPMMKKTMVHVPALLGCTVRGDTTQAALDGSSEAIRVYLGFLARHGERVDARAAFRTRVAEHSTGGAWPGMGAAFLPTDTKLLTERESAALMKRLDALHGDLRRLTGDLRAKQLDASPGKGRPIRRILQHVCCEGGYLREISGASSMQREVDEGRLDPNDALDRLFDLETARLRAMTAAERAEVIMRGQSPWTARSALRRMLEHGWEHYVEIAERLGVMP